MSAAVDIVSGFLGSGKTSLLRHVLDGPLRGTRVAVIMNEIGEIGIDGMVLTGFGAIERLVELSSGCLCCSIDEYRFDAAIQDLLDTVRPDLIVMESSGVADPLALAERSRGAGLRVDAVITVVDASNVGRWLRDTVVAHRQIRAADFLVLNKIDLVARGRLDGIERRLRRLNARAIVARAAHGAVDLPLLFAPEVAAYRERAVHRDARVHTDAHLDADGIGAFVYRSHRPLRREGFERIVAHFPRQVYRAKGLVQFSGQEWPYVFNYTCGRSDLAWIRLPGTPGETQVVVIGRQTGRYRDRVLRELRDCEASERQAT
jgi:G3E family GTPase